MIHRYAYSLSRNTLLNGRSGVVRYVCYCVCVRICFVRGYGLVVKCVLAKDESGVRFSLSAQRITGKQGSVCRQFFSKISVISPPNDIFGLWINMWTMWISVKDIVVFPI